MGYSQVRCKHCGSLGYQAGSGQWVHNWGTAECEQRPVFEPDFGK